MKKRIESPNELRLGNAVYRVDGDYNSETDCFEFNDDDKVVIITDVGDLKHLERYTLSEIVRYYEPIPITEDLLIKCGFVKLKDLLYYIEFDDLMVNIEFNEYSIFIILSIGMGMVYTDILYVHEIQNIIHSLTKKEINVKNLINK